MIHLTSSTVSTMGLSLSLEVSRVNVMTLLNFLFSDHKCMKRKISAAIKACVFENKDEPKLKDVMHLIIFGVTLSHDSCLAFRCFGFELTRRVTSLARRTSDSNTSVTIPDNACAKSCFLHAHQIGTHV